MKKIELEQLENIEGGSTYGWLCGGLMGTWGAVLAYGFYLSGPATAGIGFIAGGIWSLGSYVLCNLE